MFAAIRQKTNAMEEKKNMPPGGKEQDSARATSGGGLGQGRETAAGKPEDQFNEKGRPGKGMGGTSDTGSQPREKGPAASPKTAQIRPSEAGGPNRAGGNAIPMKDEDGDRMGSPAPGSQWSGERGMGPESRDKDNRR